MGEGTVLLRRRALGDVVLLGAITAAVPAPVTVVTEARYADIARRLHGVDRVVAWGDRVPPGPVIDLQRSLASVWRFPSARRGRKYTVARHLRRWGVGPGRLAVVDLYARTAGVRASPAPWIRLAAGARDGLAVVPGASTWLKAPPEDLLVDAARQWPGPVVVLGSADEQSLVRRVADRIGGADPVAEDGFTETLRRLSGAAAALGGDSGLLHLAAACGIPTVVVAGPTHPDDGFLRWPSSRIVQRDLPCRPCTLHRGVHCRLGDRPCMDVAAADLWRAVEEAAGAVDLAHG